MENMSPTTIDSYRGLLDLDLNIYYHGEEVCSPGRKYGPMLRDHYVLHLIESGKGTFETNHGRWELTKGQGFLIYSNVKSCYWADTTKPWSYRWVGFNGSRVKIIVSSIGLTLETPLFNAGNLMGEILAGFDVLKRAESLTKTSKTFLETSALYEIFSNLALVAPPNDKKSTRERYIQHAMDFIERNHSRDMTMTELAKHIGLNRSHLTRIFKQMMNISPTEYLVRTRIRKACELLTTQPALSVKEVAFSVGYKDPFFFSKSFRKLKGRTPSEFRESGLKL